MNLKHDGVTETIRKLAADSGFYPVFVNQIVDNRLEVFSIWSPGTVHLLDTQHLSSLLQRITYGELTILMNNEMVQSLKALVSPPVDSTEIEMIIYKAWQRIKHT
jgi:hypothetical protein